MTRVTSKRDGDRSLTVEQFVVFGRKTGTI
jgi:hypothetical protein